MNRILALFAVLASLALSSCVVESDTPTPSRVVVATPGGCRSPQPTPPVIPLPEVPDGRLLPLEVTLSPLTPPSAIVIGGSDKAAFFTRYRVRNPNRLPLRLTSAIVTQMSPDGDIADFTRVGIESDRPSIVFSLPDSTMSDIAFDFTVAPHLDVPAISEIELKIWGWMSPVLPSSVVGGAWHGVARSGHTPSLQLTRLTTKEAGSARIVPHTAPTMVLRKSKPTVTVMPLPSTTLANTDQDLIRFSIGADKAGSVAWKQISFKWVKLGNPSVGSIRVRKGSTDMDPATYGFVYSDVIPSGNPVGGLTFRFKEGHEAVETGSGSVYTVHGSVYGAKAGSSLTISVSSPDSRIVTDGLVKTFPYESYTVADSHGFLWSDHSEVPHSPAAYSLGGSTDWTNGYLVRGLAGSVTLSL